jgi:hypothetical protein
MNAKDELRDLWCSQPYTAATTREELMKTVQEKTKRFDRQISRRNVRECVAAVIVFLIFTALAFRVPDTFARIGFSIIAVTGVWIIFFLLRYGRASAPPDPGLDLDGYRHALVQKYDRQIWLLKTVKYWYLLPLWIGLMLSNLGGLRYQSHHGGIGWFSFIVTAIYTAGFAFVWWLNEVKGVGHLRNLRAQVLTIAGESDLSEDLS